MYNEGIGAFYGKTDEDAAYKALTYAADRGMTFWDCADIYGTSTPPSSPETLQVRKRNIVLTLRKKTLRS